MTPSSPIMTLGVSTGAGTNCSKFFRNLTSASTLMTEPDNATSTCMVIPLVACGQLPPPSPGLCAHTARPLPGRAAPPHNRQYVYVQASHCGQIENPLETLSAYG